MGSLMPCFLIYFTSNVFNIFRLTARKTLKVEGKTNGEKTIKFFPCVSTFFRSVFCPRLLRKRRNLSIIRGISLMFGFLFAWLSINTTFREIWLKNEAKIWCRCHWKSHSMFERITISLFLIVDFWSIYSFTYNYSRVKIAGDARRRPMKLWLSTANGLQQSRSGEIDSPEG